MCSYFVFKNFPTNFPLLKLPAAKSTFYGIQCLLRNSLPQSIKYSESVDKFERTKKKKKWKILEVLSNHLFYVKEYHKE